MRETARELGVLIPKGPSKPETRAVMESFIRHVVSNGKTLTGPYMSIGNSQWSRLGNAVVVRRMNGEFVTFLDATKGGVMGMAPKGL